MVRRRELQLAAPAADLHKPFALLGADPLDAAARQLPLVRHVEQAELEARGAEVGDEDLHDHVTTLPASLRVREYLRTSDDAGSVVYEPSSNTPRRRRRSDAG